MLWSSIKSSDRAKMMNSMSTSKAAAIEEMDSSLKDRIIMGKEKVRKILSYLISISELEAVEASV